MNTPKKTQESPKNLTCPRNSGSKRIDEAGKRKNNVRFLEKEAVHEDLGEFMSFLAMRKQRDKVWLGNAKVKKKEENEERLL